MNDEEGDVQVNELIDARTQIKPHTDAVASIGRLSIRSTLWFWMNQSIALVLSSYFLILVVVWVIFVSIATSVWSTFGREEGEGYTWDDPSKYKNETIPVMSNIMRNRRSSIS